MNKLLVSPSPHTHGKESTQSIMRDVLIALAPAMLVSILSSGWSALMLILVGAAACVLTEFLIQKYLLKRPVTVSDLSAVVTGCLLALNLPPNSPWWLIVIGSVVAIGVAKMTFGGLGQNIFNPALVGRVFLLVSFPVLMTTWDDSGSMFGLVDAFSGATPLGAVKEGLKNGMTLSELTADNLTFSQQFFFNMGGSAGEFSAVALILGFIYLLCRRVIKATIPVTILCTVFVVSGIFWLADPERFTNPVFNLFTGGLLLGAIFMATDYVTSPMTTKGQIIFGIGIGLITVFVRYFGSYPEGVSFAILIMNCTVPLLNKYCKPRRFGEVKK
ncbi:MAG: RnfABCDGE type electron transport complex subunit D [Bacteroidales bacterium]|jgi:electron transport complex protein RnfD|nr:RnfABCDGE type electron transport complex subunit D [Bacteroidales bacterium]MBR4352305.1 RnfABCDGE type electron transport complex subunit D [Bacteroidales bacterium]